MVWPLSKDGWEIDAHNMILACSDNNDGDIDDGDEWVMVMKSWFHFRICQHVHGPTALSSTSNRRGLWAHAAGGRQHVSGRRSLRPLLRITSTTSGPPTCFEIIRKIGSHPEKSGQFWKHPENWRSSGKIRTVLKPSGKSSGNFRIVLKVLGQFKGFVLLYAQKLSGRAKTFRVAMLPCYPGFCASERGIGLGWS